MIVKNKMILGALAVFVIGGTGYVFQKNPVNASVSDGSKPQAMPVTVEVALLKPVQIWSKYSARLKAVDFAEIRPQVSGTITDVKFEDGQVVEKGDILYVIDPRPYEAAVNQAEAELSGARNQSSLKWVELKRAKELIKSNAVSKRTLDERTSAHSVAASYVKSAQARLDRAKIDLDYAYVKAPISGRISRAEIKVGNLVQSGSSAPLLTSIVSMQGIYADFEVDEQSYLKYIRSVARNLAEENKVPVKLNIGDNTVEYDGFVHSFDNRIDVTTGTIRARALFANQDKTLLPGMFARVKMGSPSMQDQIMISEKAIGTDQNRKFVYLVNDKNIVEYREIDLGKSMEGKRVISSGLNEGDKVITEGIIRIRPGMPVAPQLKSAKLTSQESSSVQSEDAE